MPALDKEEHIQRLEEALAEYVSKYGFTDRARRLLTTTGCLQPYVVEVAEDLSRSVSK